MRDPVTPQPLVEARIRVNEVLAERSVSEEAANKVRLWHAEVKSWQDTDNLEDAFQEGRLTLRSMSNEGPYDFSKGNDETRETVLGLVNNDAYQKPIAATAVKVDGAWQRGRDSSGRTTLLDAGGAGILRRCNPGHFVSSTQFPHGSKYRLGLHALSGSLLNPDGFVLKRYDSTVLIAFMPLPMAEDVKIFYRLRELSKDRDLPKTPSFTTVVVILASEFTRPQLASGLDMGAIYGMVQKQRQTATGQTETYNSVKYIRGKDPTTKETPQQCRTNATDNYRSILGDKANEITIIYRKHGHASHFPIFAIAVKGADSYVEVNITLPVLLPMPKYGSDPNKGKHAGYDETGFLISAQNFSRSRKV